jgi:AsmA protein
MTQSNEKTAKPRSRMMTSWRWAAVGALLLVALPAVSALILVERFDPNRYAPEIIAAVDQATGRQLSLSGPITMQLSLHPVIEASDISLSNPIGFSGPQMLTLKRIEAKISLLPLFAHRLNILKLVLVSPNIVLERGPGGLSNWDFSSVQPAAAITPDDFHGYQIALQAVEIKNGRLTIKTPTPTIIALPNLTGTADSPTAPLHISANAVLGAAPFSVSGVVGPIARFSGVGTGPWPVDLTVKLSSATATVHGAVARPRTAQGYALTVALDIPALEKLAASLPPGLLGALPPVHDITASARIADQNSTIPAIDDLSIKAGASDLSTLRPGLTLNTLDIEMASLDRPLSLTAAATLGSTPITLTGRSGPPQALLPPALLPASMPPQGSFPVTVNAQFGTASASLTGAIATPAKLAGAALSLNLVVPDLSALSPAVGTSLPAWKNITAQTTLIDPGGLGLRQAVGLDTLTVNMDNAAFGGDASLYFGPKPRLQLALHFSEVNADALLAAMPPPSVPAPATATPGPAGTKLIPNTPLPLALLKSASADVQISADTLIWHQAAYTALQGHAVLTNGLLTVSPLTGQLPGGSVTASASVDARQEPTTETLTMNAPALALAPTLKAFGLPSAAEGTMQAQLTVTSSGDTPHAIASSLNGQLGLALANGVVDDSVLQSLLGGVLKTAGLPANQAGAAGPVPVPVRCMALRIDAANGIGTIRALALDSSRLRLQGGGNVDAGRETLGIILLPQLPMLPGAPGSPVMIGGSFAAPTVTPAPAGSIQANGGDICPAALNLGRFGHPGPAAAAMMTQAPSVGASGAVATPPGGPKNLLNGLLGP